MSEIWLLVTQSPTEFKGGGIWNVIVNIHGALQASGLALLVLFFVIGVVKTCGSFADVILHYRTHIKHLLAYHDMLMCQFAFLEEYPYCGMSEIEFNKNFEWRGWINMA